jgi:hypothetical protein
LVAVYIPGMEYTNLLRMNFGVVAIETEGPPLAAVEDEDDAADVDPDPGLHCVQLDVLGEDIAVEADVDVVGVLENDPDSALENASADSVLAPEIKSGASGTLPVKLLPNMFDVPVAESRRSNASPLRTVLEVEPTTNASGVEAGAEEVVVGANKGCSAPGVHTSLTRLTMKGTSAVPM